MLNHDKHRREDSFKEHHVSQIRLRFEMPNSPTSVEELSIAMRAQGHTVELISMKNAGTRPFGVIGHIRIDGVECVAKIAGEHLPEDHPNYFEAFIRQGAIEREYDGLKAATGLTPKLIGEIVAQGQTVGVLRQFIDGMSLAEAIQSGQIEPGEALRKALELAQDIHDRGYRLWDCEPNNLWLKPDGEVILIEGDCIAPHTEEERNNPRHLEGQRIFVREMFAPVLSQN